MVKAFKQVDATEKRLIGIWRKRGFNIPSIAELLDRGKGTISRQVQLIKKPPKKKERKEFLKQCENWPRASVQCLKGAVEPPEVLECMKPIAEQEMKREIVKAKSTVPTKGTTDKTLAPKKVKKRGGAAARRMESFKKAVGKE